MSKAKHAKKGGVPNPAQASLGNMVIAVQSPPRADKTMTPQVIGSALRAANQGSFAELMGLAVTLEDRDPQWSTVLRTRKSAVTRLPITVEAALDDERHQRDADLATAIMAAPGIRRLLFDLMDGIAKGFSVVEPEWISGPVRWMPARYVYRDQRLFRTKSDDPDRLLWTPSAAEKAGWSPEEALPPGRYICHKPMLSSVPAPQAGLARIGVWLWMFKSFGWRDWVEFLEAFGHPLAVGKYPNGVSDKDKATLREAVMTAGRAAGVMVPSGMEFKFEAGATRADAELYPRLVEYFDHQASKIILGQTTTTDAVSGGHAVSQEHNLVRGDIRDGDAEDLAETLERDLIRPAIDFNYGPPPDGLYPRLRIAEPKRADIAVMSQAIRTLTECGLEVEKSVVLDLMGLQVPEEGTAPERLLRAPSRASDAQSASGTAPALPPELPPAAQAVLFSRHVRSGGAAAPYIARLARETAPAIDAMVDEVRAMLDAASAQGLTLAEVRDDLLRLYDQLSADEIGTLLAQAALVSHLAGNAEAEKKN